MADSEKNERKGTIQEYCRRLSIALQLSEFIYHCNASVKHTHNEMDLTHNEMGLQVSFLVYKTRPLS